MKKEIVKNESVTIEPQDKSVMEEESSKATQEVVANEVVESKNEATEEQEEVVCEEDALCRPCEAYDFRLQGDERKELLKEVKKDAMALKQELIASKFNTLSLRQTGKNKRMFALRHGNDVRVFINAAISGRAGGAVVEQIEECAPEKKYVVLRPQQIRLVFINEVGEAKETILEGIAAAEAVKQVQREEGVLIWDVGMECPRWDRMTEPSRLRFIRAYLEELAKQADEPVNEEQAEYIKKKDELKEELKSAKKKHSKDERARAREIAQLQQNREPKRPWEE